MRAPQNSQDSSARLARQAREQFVANAQKCLAPMAEAVKGRLLELAQEGATAREMQDRRDAMLAFDRFGSAWTDGTAKAWQKALIPPTATARVRLEAFNLELIGDEVVERKILSSRIALAILEKATWELNDLRVRMQHLEQGEELATTDIMRPEALSQLLVEQWGVAGLSREAWAMVHEVVQKSVLQHVPEAYRLTNEFLVKQGVMRDIDLSTRVKRGSSAPGGARRTEGPAADKAGDRGESGTGGYDTGGGGGYVGGESYGGDGGSNYGSDGGGTHGGGGSYGSGGGEDAGSPYGRGGGNFHGRGGAGGGGAYTHGGRGGGRSGYPSQGGQLNDTSGGRGYNSGGDSDGGGYSGAAGNAGGSGYGSAGQWGGGGGVPGRGGAGGGSSDRPGIAARGEQSAEEGLGGGGGGAYQGLGDGASGTFSSAGRASSPGGVADETRMMTSTPPLVRARMRATGVLGQLRRLLTDRIAGFDNGSPEQPSPALAQALAQHSTQVQSTEVEGHAGTGTGTVREDVVYDDAAVQQVAIDMRRRTGELKKKAATSAEKATIEIVALMFQSILAEERIPPAMRVWFARLQMPVLRVAIAEPEFFGSLEHPARQLIDRMGSCVMGFNAASIEGSALEIEIKRVVQVIEQYPETGRRVFQLVYDEFLKFLSKFLTEKGATQRVVSVAQQVEEKETLAIQYTIELRSMLADLPVRDEIRQFLFKVWAEVLALAAVRHGPQHADTLALKTSASDLVWAASAKPNRNERAQVIQDLPRLLQRLRQGMTLVGIVGKEQEANIKSIGDTLADAFLSKTEAIPQDQIDAIAKRLAHLEDFISDDPSADLPLDAESIEMMLGIDASMIEVVADGGSRPTTAVTAWAGELQLGTWFSLDHNGAITQVQYAWCSQRKQLHLFAAPSGRSYLIQARRLAAYLQAGLLLPAEEEALTVRATRDALAKLDANPERLLQ